MGFYDLSQQDQKIKILNHTWRIFPSNTKSTVVIPKYPTKLHTRRFLKFLQLRARQTPFLCEIYSWQFKTHIRDADLSPLQTSFSNPWSPEFFNTIRSWAEGCINTHGLYIRVTTQSHSYSSRLQLNPWSLGESYRRTPLLPARVLDLQATGDSKVCLKETNGERARYITLSHCWVAYNHSQQP